MAAALALHICFRHGFRWPLRDDDAVEVWTAGHELVFTLPGRVIRHLVEIHVAQTAVQREVVDLVRAEPARMPGRDERARREALRLRRRSRKRGA